MKRELLIGTMAILLAAPAASLAQPQAKATPVNYDASANGLSHSLLQAALHLPADSSQDAFLQAFVAEIAASGASEDTVLAALDAAVGLQGMPPNAVSALNSLRKRKSAGRDWTAGVDRQTYYEAPTVTTGGGSDYIR